MHWIPGGKCNTIFIIFIWVTTPRYGADRNLYRSAYGQPEYTLHTSRLTSVRFSSIKERRLKEGDKEVGLVLFMEISSLLWGRVPQKCWGKCEEWWLASLSDQRWNTTFNFCLEDGWQWSLGQEGLQSRQATSAWGDREAIWRGEWHCQTDGLEQCSLQQYSWGILVLQRAFLKS